METFPIGTEVTTVTASDEDDDEIRYSLVGDEDIIKYFYINPQSGSISVSRPLTDSEAKEFKVSNLLLL